MDRALQRRLGLVDLQRAQGRNRGRDGSKAARRLLAAAEARERFIIGTLSSLLWACIVGALVRSAIW